MARAKRTMEQRFRGENSGIVNPVCVVYHPFDDDGFLTARNMLMNNSNTTSNTSLAMPIFKPSKSSTKVQAVGGFRAICHGYKSTNVSVKRLMPANNAPFGKDHEGGLFLQKLQPAGTGTRTETRDMIGLVR